MDPLRTTTPDVLCPYPVVLIVVKNIADLVRPDGVHVFIITAHLLPLLVRDRKSESMYFFPSSYYGKRSFNLIQNFENTETLGN